MKTLDRLERDLNVLKEESLLRTLKLKTDLIDFSSNDYLGISANKTLQIECKKLFAGGLGSGGSRLLTGNSFCAEQFEITLAARHNKESALLFNSGYAANLGFFSAVPNRNSTVIYDEKIHTCIKDGMRLSLAKKVAFKHNDLEQLEKRLKSSDNETFVAIESVYSMDGDQAPIIEIADLCAKYGANLVVDEAHTTGVYGAKGAGLISELDLDHKVFAKIHTFGKGIGAHGACVVGDKVLKDYLINNARSFIFTTAMPDHTIQVLQHIYNYLEGNAEALQNKLKQKIKLYKSIVTNRTIESNSPIQVVVIPGNKAVKEASLYLEKQGYDVRPVMSPTVPKGEERLRICLHNFNSDEEIMNLSKSINQL